MSDDASDPGPPPPALGPLCRAGKGAGALVSVGSEENRRGAGAEQNGDVEVNVRVPPKPQEGRVLAFLGFSLVAWDTPTRCE